jgi:plasmid stabilization system protein ParE
VRARFSARAEREVERIDARWRAAADYAPDLFHDEVAAMLERLEKTPTIGVFHETVDDLAIYRVVLERSRYRLYYWTHGDELVVACVWSSQRKREPKLGPLR